MSVPACVPVPRDDGMVGMVKPGGTVRPGPPWLLLPLPEAGGFGDVAANTLPMLRHNLELIIQVNIINNTPLVEIRAFQLLESV